MEKDLEKLFNPKSIAIIGATPNKEKASYSVMKNVLSKFKGKIYLVNPKYDKIEGYRCYKSVKEIKSSIDLGVIIVNAKVANHVIEESMEKKIKFLIVITAGYREIGGEGVKREQELINLIKKYNYRSRIVGPNCLGILDNNSKLDILFLPQNKISKPIKGNISLIFQSGALGSAVIDKLSDEFIGISRFVSYGNACDLNEIDFLKYLIKDKNTNVIGLYLEGIRNGRKMYELFNKSKKPIVVIKGGKTEKGSKATLTHTGSLAGNYNIFKGMTEQSKVILVENFTEFENNLKIFSIGKHMLKKEVLVLTNGGGFGVLAADEIDSSKLSFYEITDKEKKKIKKFLPPYASIHNPLDLIGDANSERYKKALDVFKGNNKIGAFLVIMLIQTFSLDEKVIKVLCEFNNSVSQPVVGIVEGGSYAYYIRKRLEQEGIVTYTCVNEAIQSLEMLYKWSISHKG